MKVTGKHEFDNIPLVNTADKLSGSKVTTTDPTNTSDDANGYYVGYTWVNTTTGKNFTCTDATTNSAVWVDFASQITNINQAISNIVPSDELLSGSVIYTGTGFVYDNTVLTYKIGGALYTAAGGQTFTLTAADSTNDRIDLVYVNTAGTVAVKVGTPAPAPVRPSLDDPSDELIVTFITVATSATTPSTTFEAIYLENNEWTVGGTGTSITAAATSNPAVGTKHVDAALNGNETLSQTLTFTRSSDYTLPSNLETVNLLFRIKIDSQLPNSMEFRLRFINSSGIGLTSWVSWTNWKNSIPGQYGFDVNSTSGYQQVSVPLSNLKWGNYTIRGLEFQFRKNPVAAFGQQSFSFPFDMDEVKLEIGSTVVDSNDYAKVSENGYTSSYIPVYDNQTNYLKESVIRSLNESVSINSPIYASTALVINKGSLADALRIVDGNEGSGKFLKCSDGGGTAIWADISVTESQISDLGNYSKISSTPANNQLAVWTGGDTIEGDANLTWSTTTLAIANSSNGNTSNVTATYLLSKVETNDANCLLYGYGDTGSFSGELILAQARGTVASPTPTQSGNTLGEIQFAGAVANPSHKNAAVIKAQAQENFIPASTGVTQKIGTRLLFQTAIIGASTVGTRYEIDGSGNHEFTGNVGIGTTPDSILDAEGGNGEFQVRLDDSNFNKALINSSNGGFANMFVASSNTANSELQFGIIGSTATQLNQVGSVNDTFILATSEADDMNFINTGGTGTTDNIAFYAGKDVSTTLASTTPDLIILGDGSNKGFVGIGTSTPTENLEVTGNVRINGQGYSYQPTELTISSNGFTFNCNSGNGQEVDLAAATNNVTVTFTNMVQGSTYFLKIKQKSSSPVNITNYTVAGGNVKFPGGTAPTISTGASACDTMVFYYDGTDMYANFAQNYSY